MKHIISKIPAFVFVSIFLISCVSTKKYEELNKQIGYKEKSIIIKESELTALRKDSVSLEDSLQRALRRLED